MRRVLVRSLLCVSVAVPYSARAQEVHPAGIPVDMTAPMLPQGVVAEGKRHHVYELHVTNFGRAELELQKIEVLSGSAVVATYAGDSLNGILARPGTPGLADKRVIGPGLRLVAFIDVIVDARRKPLNRLTHRLTFAPITPANSSIQSVVYGARIRVSAEPPVVLGPPVSGAGWIALHGLSNESVHRRTVLAIEGGARDAQRFAVDWTRVGPDGQVFRGDASRNANWTPYGTPVLAVQDARVVDMQDGIAENDPTSETRAVPITLQTVGGNYLVLALTSGRYAFYAHLQPGSFCVRLGQTVKRGDMLAKLGNSGQSDAPHLHLHIVDAPSPLAAEGLPMVFDSYALEGHIASTKVLVDGTGWRPSGPATRVRGEMPVENAVVDFGSAARPATCRSR